MQHGFTRAATVVAVLTATGPGLEAQTPVSWAPHGDSLVVATTIDGQSGVYIVPASGTGHRLVVALNGLRMHPAYPAWSPDGAWIAYSGTIEGNTDIYRIPVRGGDPVRLTHDSAQESYPAWSPNGSRLAFMSNRSGTSQLYVMRPDGSAQVRVTHSTADDWNPSWSPDGRRLVFETNRHGRGQDELYTIDLGTKREKRLTDNAVNDIFPDWSPGGDAVAYCAVADRHAVVQLLDLTSSTGRRLVDDACLPRWSPDAKRLAFDRNGAIVVMDVATGRTVEIKP